MNARRISVVIADDHPVYRRGLAAALRACPELELVAEAEDGESVLAEIRRLVPRVAVVDLQLPGIDGIEVAAAVASEGLATRMVILSAYEDRAAVERAHAAGVWAYLPKIGSATALCDTLVAVARGDLPPPSRARHDGAEQPALTARELEILRLTAEGRSAPDIAEELALSTATVKTHLQHTYEKLGVSERAAAVAQAIRRGLLG
jgi:two-component system nitrate/nitrite response regulator NarL